MKLIIILLLIFLWTRYGFAESVSLRWDAPTTNVDATPLTDLDGYKIYYGTATGVYNVTIDVGNKLCTIVEGLTVGMTYYFAATAYDVLLNESSYSNEVSKLIAIGDIGHCDVPTLNFSWKTRHKTDSGLNGGFQ